MLEEFAAGSPGRASRFSYGLDRIIKWSARRFLRWSPAGSIIVELPNNQRIRFGKAGNDRVPVLKLNNYRAIFKAFRRGSIGFAEAYIDGDIVCSNLVGLFQFFVRNQAQFEKAGRGVFKVRTSDWFAHQRRRNTREGSRRNIADHYDLSNEFFRLWLDPEMNYSSGIFDRESDTLEDAQTEKLDRILSLLALEDNQSLLEIGCGWGALARRAIRKHDITYDGITLSNKQLAHAQGTADFDGYGDRCRFHLKDYRDLEGQFEAIVSVEMIEAVGKEYWPQYFDILNKRLKPGGTALIQAITIDESRYQIYRQKPDFIQRYIFPGGMLPTSREISRHAAAAGLVLDHQELFGHSYALTLREWRARFEETWPQIEVLGFDDRFRRCWSYYLAYCEAGFLGNTTDVGLYRLKKPGKN